MSVSLHGIGYMYVGRYYDVYDTYKLLHCAPKWSRLHCHVVLNELLCTCAVLNERLYGSIFARFP